MDLSTYGLSVLLLAQLANVHIDTARRWKRAGKMPDHVAEIMRLKLDGDLGMIAADWSGFRLTKNQLWTPEGTGIRPGDIRAIPYRRAQLIELERELREPRQQELF